MTTEERAIKTARQRELRKLNPERYLAYDNKPARKFSKAVDCYRRKIVALKMVCPENPFQCKICGNINLLQLTIDHNDEAGSERNLYSNIISGKTSHECKDVLCYSCNAGLKVLGHGDKEKVMKHVNIHNEARKRSIESGIIKEHELQLLTFEAAKKLAGIGDDNAGLP